MFGFIKNWKRRKILAQPFPEAWTDILEQQWPLYLKLPPALQNSLREKVQIFIAEKTFEGLKGFTITDEVRVLISAQACLLLLGNDHRDFDSLKSILVYPNHYRSKSTRVDQSGVVQEKDQSVLGESWDCGTVTLSWQSAKQGAVNDEDGHNVVIHEFAHQMDQESGRADGAPILRSRSRYAAWQRVLSKEYERLQSDVSKGRRTVMDDYGATEPAEFFAVATECFFEKPEQLKKRRPELYGELQIFYGQDPVTYG